MNTRGRSCPPAYRYRPEALAQPARLSADTLFVVGGLYGNLAALRAVLERTQRERDGAAAIVFNGDFHWLDVGPEDFRTIGETVLGQHAIKGNAEAELASDDDAGCGCAYPDYVDDAVVDRSNLIIARLRETAQRFPELVSRLGGLPRWLVANVGADRVGIVHGDPESLAGWRLALEAMEPGDAVVRQQVGWRGQPTTPAEVRDWFHRTDVSVLASTHTGLPYAQDFLVAGRPRLVINNAPPGSATSLAPPTASSRDCRATPSPPPTASTASRSAPCAATRCRCGSIRAGGERASWHSGRPAAPATAPTSAGSPAAPRCGSSRPRGAT